MLRLLSILGACALLGAASAEFASLQVPLLRGEGAYKVLFTGFGPFLNFTTNPTMKMALHLQENPCWEVQLLPMPGVQTATTLSLCFEAHVLPVNRTGAMWTTQYLSQVLDSASSLPFDMVLHTGLENQAKGLKLETVASNNLANDSGGASTGPAIPGAPDMLPTTVDLGWVDMASISAAAQFNASLADARQVWSRDAGQYYCNEVLYRSLHLLRSRQVVTPRGGLLPAMFVHAPNSTTASLATDLALIRQVAAHAVWASLQAPGATPPPPPPAQDSITLRRGTLALAIMGAMVGGVLLVAAFLVALHSCGRRAVDRRDSALLP